MGTRGGREFRFEGADDGSRAAVLDDSIKLRAIVGHKTDSFNQDIVDPPSGRKFYQAIDHRDRFRAGSGGDPSGNFATVRRDFDSRTIGNFRPLGSDDAGGVGSNHQFGKEISDTFLFGCGELSPTWAHRLAGDEVEGEGFFQGRANARRQVFVSVTGVGDREDFVNPTAEHGSRVVDGCGVGEAHGAKDEEE